MNSTASVKKCRIMIITDESIIEQIERAGGSSIFQSAIVIESKKDQIRFASSLAPIACRPSTSTKSKTKPKVCVVCGSVALGYNFDALTCESCKAFFRRNALKDPKTFQCRRESNCKISIDTRPHCSSCRLAKCFREGMKSDRMSKTEKKRQKPNEKINPENTAGNDIAQLFNEVDFGELMKDDDLDFLRGTNLNDLLSNEAPDTRRALMTPDDLKLLETIQSSYEKRVELALQSGISWTPTGVSSALLETIHARLIPALRLLLFFKQIPEFDQLNVDDRVLLTKYNLMALVFLNGSLFYRDDINLVVETENDKYWNTFTMEAIFGNEICSQLDKNFKCFVRIAQYDRKIMLLALIILIFTQATSIDFDAAAPLLNDNLAVYRAQNYYTELLWKYMETVHGSEKTAKTFQELVTNFTVWKTMDGRIRKSIQQVLSPADVDGMLPLMKSLLHLNLA